MVCWYLFVGFVGFGCLIVLLWMFNSNGFYFSFFVVFIYIIKLR